MNFDGNEAIEAIRERLALTKTTLAVARRMAANRAEVAVLEGTVRRVEARLKTLESMTTCTDADWSEASRGARRQRDAVVEQIGKAFAELDAGLARLEKADPEEWRSTGFSGI